MQELFWLYKVWLWDLESLQKMVTKILRFKPVIGDKIKKGFRTKEHVQYYPTKYGKISKVMDLVN